MVMPSAVYGEWMDVASMLKAPLRQCRSRKGFC